jgi:uncharacterized membrane protein
VVLLKGPYSIGAQFLYVRALSFIIAGQIHRKSPFSKMMGPLMHLPFLPVLFNAIKYLMIVENKNTDKFQYYFILYTTIITMISFILDSIVVIQFMSGKPVGTYDKKNNEKKR